MFMLMLTFRFSCMLLQISNVHQSTGSLGCTTELQRSRWRTGLGSKWAGIQAQKRLSGFWVTNGVNERESWQRQTTTEDICRALGGLHCRQNWQEKKWTERQATSRVCMSLGQADMKKPFPVGRRFIWGRTVKGSTISTGPFLLFSHLLFSALEGVSVIYV